MELTDKFEIKVFILFLLKNIKEPLDIITINDIVVLDGFVSYFNFVECFSELCEAGQVTTINVENNRPHFVISPLGEEAVANVETRLFNTVREKALRSALRLLAFYKHGTRILSKVEPYENGYMLKCTFENKTKTLMNIDVFLTEEFYANKVKQNFDDRAEHIYRGVLALLAGDVNYIFDD